MPDFDMPVSGSWEQRGGWVVRALMRDLDLTIEQAGGIVGNLGFESAGFTELHEIGQPDGAGGYGWAQWTADRRQQFFDWCNANGFPGNRWGLDEANYGFLLYELRGAYKGMVDELRNRATLDQCVWLVGEMYERPGGTTAVHLPGYDGRLDYARRAVAGAQAAGGDKIIAGLQDAVALAKEPQTALLIQNALFHAGYDPGPLDNIWGPRSQEAFDAWKRSL